MSSHRQGFSLVELMMALTIVMGLSAMLFQLFHQNERVIRDQSLIMEMQQTARLVALQIVDEVRMAGQGVPVHAAAFDATPAESVAVFLASSTAHRIDFRAGLSNAEAAVTTLAPIDFSLGNPRVLSVTDASPFSGAGFVYVFGPAVWPRAEVTATGPTYLMLTPRNTGSSATAIHFAAPPTVSLDEAVSIHLSGSSVRRATATDLTNPASPAWSGANEIGRNFRELNFTYYDKTGMAIAPNSLSNRLLIARVDIRLTVETAGPLSDGTRPAFTLALLTIPRNARITVP